MLTCSTETHRVREFILLVQKYVSHKYVYQKYGDVCCSNQTVTTEQYENVTTLLY